MAWSISCYLPFSRATTPLQALTYLLGICLFSISFLVFLNSSISFVITDLIGLRHGVGDIVGTLGFVDELVALIACPVWGLVSDRLGVRLVAVIGYLVIGLSLFVFVQAHNVYPQLLLARILFAVGATAAATMVTAILPSVTDDAIAPAALQPNPPKPRRNPHDSITPSVDSELTITPERFRELPGGRPSTAGRSSGEDAGAGAGAGAEGRPSALAGYVGLFTGCGALVALVLFLPLPTRFGQREGVTLGQAVSYSFYLVGSVALAIALFVAFGLRGLKGEEGKGWRLLLGLKRPGSEGAEGAAGRAGLKRRLAPYWHLLRDSIRLGLSDSDIALGYLGGFVARASTVAISLFIPLFVNSFFMRNGFCQGSPNDPSPELKQECRQGYVLAAILTGIAQSVGLVCAPIFGYLSSRRGKYNTPVIIATALGIAGYAAFPRLPSPELRDRDGRGGSLAVVALVSLMGVSQIGVIVCSLGSLGRGVLRTDVASTAVVPGGDEETAPGRPGSVADTAPLLENGPAIPEGTVSRIHLKGSVAGVYSWCGGAAILLLTKLGGYLFDVWSPGAPFYLMAAFNAVLLAITVAIDVGRATREGAIRL